MCSYCAGLESCPSKGELRIGKRRWIWDMAEVIMEAAELFYLFEHYTCRLCTKIQMLPGQCGRRERKTMVEPEKNVLPNS